MKNEYHLFFVFCLRVLVFLHKEMRPTLARVPACGDASDTCV